MRQFFDQYFVGPRPQGVVESSSGSKQLIGPIPPNSEELNTLFT